MSDKPRRPHWFYGTIAGMDQEGLNLVEFPFALLSRASHGQKAVTFTDNIRDQSSGERLERSLTISANVDSELPNYFDQDVLVGLNTLAWRKNRFTEQTVDFTLYELVKVMQLKVDGRLYARLAKSLDNWQGVRFKWSHWRVGDSWANPKATALIQDYDLTRTGNRKPESRQCFTWSRIYFEAMQDGERKPFDADFYFSLTKPTQRRMFRYLDKRLYQRVSYNYPIKQFCMAKLGMGERKQSQYPEKLEGAYDELVESGFLRNLPRSERYSRAKNGELFINFKRGRGLRSSIAVPKTVVEPVQTSVESELVKQLRKRGIKNDTPLHLLGLPSSSPEHVEAQIANYDHRRSNGEELGPGWLINAIKSEDGHSFRDDYVSEEEKQQRAKAIAERKRKQEATEQARKKAEDERTAARRDALRSFMAKLSSAEQEAFFEDAKSSNAFAFRFYRDAVKDGRTEQVQEYREMILLQHFEKTVVVQAS